MKHVFSTTRIKCAALLVLAVAAVHTLDARTLRLLVVGNSFSNNATRFLPDLAKEGGHELIVAKAQKGGCSLQQHWDAVEAFLANPDDPKAKIYGGKSLHEHIGGKTWDVITLQQYSLHSSDLATYRPYAAKLHAHLKRIQPTAEIVLHQTWAYRADAARFGQIAPGKFAANQREMWTASRAAYWSVARELGTRIIPVGDAFWRVDSDSQWGFKAEHSFDEKKAEYPKLPNQEHSLHVGYRWNADKKLGKDANHANVAGEYLGALVWYGTLFGDAPEKVRFVPPGVDAEFAAHLREVASAMVREVEIDNRKIGRVGAEKRR